MKGLAVYWKWLKYYKLNEYIGYVHTWSCSLIYLTLSSDYFLWSLEFDWDPNSKLLRMSI